ncbi:MAG: hypothetical protein MUP70_00335 [Candidatus Aminicenantes bacterium]|nr:hypothetical protein [Candidatus Aminicenantes bacterium]
MREVVIQIPTIDTEQNIEIDVKINGRKRVMKYRVEIYEWEEELKEGMEKVDVLRRIIMEHDKDWRLIQIGMPTDKNIPIMFQKRTLKEVESA